MGVLHDYFAASDRAAAVDQAIGPGGDWLRGTSLAEAGADWIDAKGLDPNVVVAQLVAHAEAVPFADQADEPELVWPEPPYPQGESIGPDSPWDTGLLLQQLPDRWRDVLAELPEDAVAMVAMRWQEIDEVDFGDYRIAREAVETFTALARRARTAGAHLYCRSSV
ncbi:hypothetical protein STRCI_000321 [Streptomyces cinnabarinus]|uniref:DUF1877 domain-containing protein n=1 Tax=Streptomyces cinnabarinus TaxID=67287 RepID=A0ABY7K4L2_9ACTN|nr:hypothetical protein [Streptomyces cinnabarinus]WAZ19284.1 hypothetical protein STRCI_000321 [Streptomyces cinnabarinus]